ncbi:MAG TPA: hypothetical protein DIW31_03650 [Bacteroidales bacterium]|nr:hypothetical protein [Bacteroidales bacterium]
MEEQMKLMINMLKERIKHNLQIIKKNEAEIRGILTQPVSNKRSEILKEMFHTNRILLDENQDSLAIELQIINFIVKFKRTLKHQANNVQSTKFIENSNTISKADAINEEQPDKQEQDDTQEQVDAHEELDLLSLTVMGNLPYNQSHPLFNDEDFFEDLMESFKQLENYEMCSEILRVKGRR